MYDLNLLDSVVATTYYRSQKATAYSFAHVCQLFVLRIVHVPVHFVCILLKHNARKVCLSSNPFLLPRQVIDCNCVIVLDQGRVIRQGPPQDLLLTTPFIESRANVASPKHTSGAKNTDIDSGIGDGVVSNTDRASTGGIDTIFDF